eukprot:gene13928-29631_t
MINWTRSETSTMADSTVIWIHKPLEINYKNINSAYVKSDSFPYFELSILAMINFTSSLSVSSLFTYVPFMVVEMGLVDNLDKAGFYAGPIAASLFFGRFFSSYLWGYMADIYGRKPILTMALLSILIFSIFFGLSKNLITAVTSRFLLGFFNPSIGIIKTLISELCSKKHEIRGIAVTSGSWSLGLIFGPALGSYLSNPVLKYPNIFTKDTALMSTILDEVYPLWALCSVAHGGLDLTSVQVANILSISGFVLVLYMFLISPVINEFLGNKRSFLLGSKQRGSLNGINMIVGSFAKSIGPLIGSTVFAWTASVSILAYKAFKNDMNVVLVTDISNDEHENSPLIKITTG